MVHFFKHLALRIWVTLMTGSLLTLFTQPHFEGFFGLKYSIFSAAAQFVLLFFITGYFFDRIGNMLLKGFIREAASLERFGKDELVEKTFRKALTVYNSFLRSPFSSNKNTRNLKKQIAQFYTAGSVQNRFSESFIISYLIENPRDKDIASRWLKRHDEKVLSEKKYHEITGILSETYPKSLSVQAKLAKVFLYAMRTDYTALNTYRTVIDANKKASDLVLDELSRIFIVNGRADDHALEIYLRAWKLLKRREQLAGGLYACLKWVPKTESTKSNLIAAKMLIKKIDKEDLDVMIEGFKKPDLNIRRDRKRKSKKRAQRPGQRFTFITGPVSRIGLFFSKLSGYFGSGLSSTTRSVRKIQKSHYLKPVLKWSVIVLSLVLLIVFVSSTARHLFRKQTPEKTESTILKIATADPFTIQVAAYRQEINAKKYIDQLKESGLDAYYVVVHTSSSKWYQVRISHFRTKDEARTYGLSLKKKGQIKDFYVANYKNPEKSN